MGWRWRKAEYLHNIWYEGGLLLKSLHISFELYKDDTDTHLLSVALTGMAFFVRITVEKVANVADLIQKMYNHIKTAGWEQQDVLASFQKKDKCTFTLKLIEKADYINLGDKISESKTRKNSNYFEILQETGDLRENK